MYQATGTMKRAAGQIRKGRRNKGGDKESNDDVSHQPECLQQSLRRKPTQEEAALTAKNYRLAKELSDLRVRHREEQKAVGRLTMENMNLASRWREAIGHVALLKKELAVHQRKAAEALNEQKAQAHLQRNFATAQSPEPMHETQHNSTSKAPSTLFVDQSPIPVDSNVAGSSLQDVAAEMDRMDRILAAHQSQSQAPTPPPSLPKETATSPASGAPISSRDSLDSHSPELTDRDEENRAQSMDQAVTPSPHKDDDYEEEEEEEEEDEFDSKPPCERSKDDFFSMFAGGSQVDLDEVEVEDPRAAMSTPSGTPPQSSSPSPPQTSDASLESFADAQNDRPQELVNADPPLFPMTASPKLMVKAKVTVYNEEFPGDITAEVTRYPRSAERRIASEFNDIAEEENTASTIVPVRKRPPPLPLSGIDAFEASFATKFPDSFSPAEDNKSSSSEANTEEYNPFFPSPSKEEELENTKYASPCSLQSMHPADFEARSYASSNQSTGRYGRADTSPSPVNSGRPRSAALDQFYSSSYNIETSARNLMNGAIPVDKDSPKTAGLVANRYQIHSQFGREHNDSPPPSNIAKNHSVGYATPPHGEQNPEVSAASEEPRRPEKLGAAAARARYEKALQPRGFTGNSRRFPRRGELEVERGASPVSAPSGPSTNCDAGKTESYDLPVNRLKLAMAQARVKERTAAYTTRAPLPAPDINQCGENLWAARPSPTDSVASKPWDEEIGDIPLGSPSGKSKDASIVNGTVANIVNGTNHTRQSITRDRPWDRSSQLQDTPTRTSHTVAIGAANYALPKGLENNDINSPNSRFIAAGKSRRLVKQPISYAEPSLNSKLRSGDVFFAKAELEEANDIRSHPSPVVHL